jgi:hypothetical protein
LGSYYMGCHRLGTGLSNYARGREGREGESEGGLSLICPSGFLFLKEIFVCGQSGDHPWDG